MASRTSSYLWRIGYVINYRLARVRTQWILSLVLGTLGKKSTIYRPLLLLNPDSFHIGANVLIRHGARLEAVTSHCGTTFNPRITIGDGCSIEQNFHLTCAQEITIGKRVSITENVGIFDIWHRYDDVHTPIADQPLRCAPVSIGDGSFIGMGAVIHPGVHIGKQCLIGANSVVTRSIPDYSVAIGAPAKVIKQFDFATQSWRNI